MVTLTIIRNLSSMIGGIAFFAIFYYWWKMYRAHKEVGDNYLTDNSYNKYKKLRRIAGIICLLGGIIGSVIPMSAEEKAEREQKRIEREMKQLQKEADDMFEKLDKISPESKGKIRNGIGSLVVGGMSCVHCGQESVYNYITPNEPKGTLDCVVISGKTPQDLAKTKCRRSDSGEHELKNWYKKVWTYSKETGNRWYLGKNQIRDKELYMECLRIREGK